MFGLDLEPVVFCLFASLVWAPLVLLAAAGFDRGREPAASEVIWLTALGVSALPTLLAPALGAAGISLRHAPPATEFIAAPIDFQQAETFFAAVAAPAPQPTLTPDILINALGLLYLYGVALAFGVWLVRSFIFAAHVRASTPIDHPELSFALTDWAARLGVQPQRSLRIRKSDAISSVCVYGVFRPIILIPTTLDARVPFKDLVLMGAHELAHVKRGDGVFFAACSFARILFWFNPFVKHLAARAELAAEQNADRLVLEAGADRRAYAACFVEGLRFAAERARETRVAVPSFTPFDRKSRRDRLDAILSGKEGEQGHPSKLLLATGFFLAAALAFAQAAFAVAPAQTDVLVDEGAASPAPVSAAEGSSWRDKNTGLDLPVDGEVTLAYGKTSSALGDKRPKHEGVDIAAAKGSPVKAPASGVIVDATDVYQGNPAWGKVVVIRHDNGLISRFAHLDSYSVARGDSVKKGDVFAAVGETGRVSGPHLHFEMLRGGERIDPMRALAVAAPAPAPKPDSAPAPKATPAPTVLTPEAPLAPEPAIAPVPAIAAKPVIPAEIELAPAPPEAPLLEEGKTVLKLRSVNGKDEVVILAGGNGNSSFARTLTKEESAQLQAELKKMKREIKKAKKQHAEAMKKLGKEMSNAQASAWNSAGDDFAFDFDFDSNFDGLNFEGFDVAEVFDVDEIKAIEEEAARAAEKAARRWNKNFGRDIARAEREREQALREAQEAREEALREAQQAREEALRDHEASLRDAEIERQEALKEAQADREEALRLHAEAIEEAKRALEDEQARIEDMIAELEREQAR